ncbi:MAG: hypothetical protein QF704_15275, partial [Anaerolineales bacterium]|nr:hypothetical protein [Anaerolineales bacterium]
MKIDLHMHTTHSYQGKVGKKTMSDSSIRMEDIPILARAAGLDGIVITDHMTLEAGGGEFLRVQSEYPDFLLLRGMEYHTDHSHILLFGIKDDSVCKIFGKYGPVQEAIDYVIAQGGIVVPSHPYQQGYSFEMCDHIFNLRGLTALEIENGQM